MSTAPLATLPGRPCPVAAALEVVGERWALLVVREIALGANRFGAIVSGDGGHQLTQSDQFRQAAGIKEMNVVHPASATIATKSCTNE